MQIKYTFKNFKDNEHADLKRAVKELAETKLEPHLKRVEVARVRLGVQIERHKTKDRNTVALRLHLPKKVLVSKEEAQNLESALNEAFEELQRQLMRYVARLRKEDQWRRKARRAQLRRLKAATGAAAREDRQAYYDLVHKHIPKLERFVRHELTYMRASGDLPPDYPRIEDIVDETLARAFSELDKKPSPLSIDNWLIRIAIDIIAEEVARFRAEEGMESIHKSVSPLELIPEDEIFEFWEPDEMLTIEDLAANPQVHKATEPIEEKEGRLYFYKLLGLLPVKWRRALTLHVIEGVPMDQIAETMGVDEDTVKRWIEHSEAYLREKMIEADYSPPETGSYLDYLVLYPTPEEYKEQIEEEFRKLVGLQGK